MAVAHMLELGELRQITEESVRAAFPTDTLDHAEVEPILDSRGEDALRVRIVLRPGAPDRISGESLLRLLVRLRQTFEARGEERAPIVQYATTDELSSAGEDGD